MDGSLGKNRKKMDPCIEVKELVVFQGGLIGWLVVGTLGAESSTLSNNLRFLGRLGNHYIGTVFR
jgi:hypothetical protein